jgi:lantibiotic biosynthesis protein
VYGSREWLDSQRAVTRDAWCYGSPGVARALHLAGVALDRNDWRQFAIDAMAAVYRRPVAARGIDSPIFCHGVAGLLQISLRFSYDTGLPMFGRAVAELTEQLLAAIDLGRPMAVANIEPGGNLVDQPGLLDGATGVCLTLLSAAADEPPAWDRIFALE